MKFERDIVFSWHEIFKQYNCFTIFLKNSSAKIQSQLIIRKKSRVNLSMLANVST